MQPAPDPDEEPIPDGDQDGPTDSAENPIRGFANNPIFVPKRPTDPAPDDTQESFSA